MEPKHLLQLAVVLEKGSITEAAQYLSITQPTLTRNMATLEMQAGASLFSRSRFGVRSTPLGDTLAREGRAIALRLHEAREAISRHKAGMVNNLRVGVGPLLGLALMPRLTLEFLAAFPQVNLTLTTGRPQLLVDALIDGQYDLVIAPSVYKQLPTGVSRALLVEDAIGVFCGVAHPAARLGKVSPKLLSDSPWINAGVASPFQSEELDFLAANGIRRPHTQLATVGDAVILLKVLEQGRHLAVLPRLAVRMIDQEQRLRELPLRTGPSRRDVMTWTRDAGADQPAVVGFIDIARTLLHAGERSKAPAATV